MFRPQALALIAGIALIGCSSGGSSGGGSQQQQRPTANPGAPYTGEPGVAIQFNGSASTDPQGENLTYAWNFGDNSTGSGAKPSHSYAVASTYQVTLTVTDTSDLSGAATVTATVTVKPPTANAGGPYTGMPGAAIQFTGSASTDPQGENLTYAWNFGDNSTGGGAQPSHTYAIADNYTVSLKVTNTSGLSASANTPVYVESTSGSSISGTVMSGTQPLIGAHVYLFAAGSTGYGNSSLSLLGPSQTGLFDSVGPYMLSDNEGKFTVPSGFGCPVGSQLYLYSLGGSLLASSPPNPAAGMLAAFGPCSSLDSATSVVINEVTTIAAAFAISGFATDATHISSSGSNLATVGVANAFANAANLASLSSGTALATTPVSNGTVPQPTINTLANILNACVGSGSANSTQCITLFSNALSSGMTGTAPQDTATTAINIAHNPGANVTTIFAIQATNAPFLPDLASAPNDLSLALTFPVGTPSELWDSSIEPWSIAIDGDGNAWVGKQNQSVAKLSSTGVILADLSGFSSSELMLSNAIAVDNSGNAWVSDGDLYVTKVSSAGVYLGDFTSLIADDCENWGIAADAQGNMWNTLIGDTCSSVSEYANSGTVLSGEQGFTSTNMWLPYEIAIDGSGNAWVLNEATNFSATLTKLSPSGSVLSGTGGYVLDTVFAGGLAIDRSGNLWLADQSNTKLMKVSNTGAILGTFQGGGFSYPYKLAIDGAGNIWVGNAPHYAAEGSASVSEFTSSGLPITGANGYNAGGVVNYPSDLAIDGSGDVWITPGFSANYDGPYDSFVIELIGVAVPVITPISAGLPQNPTSDGSSLLGTRP